MSKPSALDATTQTSYTLLSASKKRKLVRLYNPRANSGTVELVAKFGSDPYVFLGELYPGDDLEMSESADMNYINADLYIKSTIASETVRASEITAP